jgi:hypothetical protein
MVTRANGAHHGTRPRFICDEEETLKRKKPGRLDLPGFFEELVRSREVAESSGSAIPSVGAGTSPALTAKGNFHRSPHRRGADRRSRLAFVVALRRTSKLGTSAAVNAKGRSMRVNLQGTNEP